MLDEIRAVHQRHVDSARASAERIAAEAAEMTEEGIRDLIDDEGEGEAAARTVMVRQASVRAMQAIRRVHELELAGRALAFGRTTSDDGEAQYVGRISVIDDDEALLVDWRSHAAAPFYRATPVDRQGVRHRRHLLYAESTDDVDGELVGYSDELFDLEVDDPAAGTALRGEAAILQSLASPTSGRMKSVVATIQSEQDAIIRAPSDGALVVQGGPGTGKTVVALHRAAYLLYNQRAALAENGVLIVGPTSEFLDYISGVLPSLGETGVVSVTAGELYPGVRRGHPEPEAAAELKGRAEMVDLVAHAVRDRQRRPVEPLLTWYGSTRVRLEVDALEVAYARASQQPSHNDGARWFRAEIIEQLVEQVHDPSFADREDALATFRSAPDIRRFLLRHWPPLTAEMVLNDLFGSPGLLHSACAAVGIGRAGRELLARERTPFGEIDKRRWSYADLPLLDELLHLVGAFDAPEIESDRLVERDDADEFELAEAEDLRAELDDDDDEFDDEEELDAVALGIADDVEFSWEQPQ